MQMESRLLVVFFCTNPLKYIHITSCERFANYVDKTFSGWKEISTDLTVGYQINFSHLANPKALIQRATHFAFQICIIRNRIARRNFHNVRSKFYCILSCILRSHTAFTLSKINIACLVYSVLTFNSLDNHIFKDSGTIK